MIQNKDVTFNLELSHLNGHAIALMNEKSGTFVDTLKFRFVISEVVNIV